MPKTLLQTSDDNRVTIRVWKMNTGDSKVGHATIQTHGDEGIYASFWPKESEPSSPRTQSVRFTKADENGRLVRTPEVDIFLENRQPDLRVDLFSLNAKAINAAFAGFKESNCQWDLMGSSIFGYDNTRNCSGLCHFLLQHGGIETFVKSYAGTVKEAGGAILTELSIKDYVLRLQHSNEADADPATERERSEEAKIRQQTFGMFLVGWLGAMAVGKLADISAGTTLIVTPNGIANLAQWAKEEELKRYEYTDESALDSSADTSNRVISKVI